MGRNEEKSQRQSNAPASHCGGAGARPAKHG